jgi:hypothetical protein
MGALAAPKIEGKTLTSLKNIQHTDCVQRQQKNSKGRRRAFQLFVATRLLKGHN